MKSPDGTISLGINAGNNVTWTLSKDGVKLISPSEIALTLDDGTIYGGKLRVSKVKRRSVSQDIPAQNFKRSVVHDGFNELKLITKDFGIVFRVYDDGAAYRFVTHKAVTVASETAEFRLSENWQMWVPYVRDKERLAFLPLTVDGPDGIKLCFTESDLLNYPGMYLHNPDGGTALHGVYAPVPKDIEQGGHNMLQGLVKSREPYIYKGTSAEALPWRVVVVAEEAKAQDATSSQNISYLTPRSPCSATPRQIISKRKNAPLS